MKEPKKEDYGWCDERALYSDERGWMIQGGEEAYEEAMNQWRKQNNIIT